MRKIFLTCFLVSLTFVSFAQTNNFKRTEDVIYGRKFGTALTLDVFQPEKPNGYGIIFVVHGEVSGEEMIEYFKEFGLWEKVSPNEKKFLINKKPTDQERIEYSWKIEGLNVLLWSLSKFDDLSLPYLMISSFL